MQKKFTSPIKIKIQNNDFDVAKETKILQQDQIGAIVTFVGIVRGFDEKTNQSIQSMTLDYYPGMTELEIEKIIKESCKRWEISGVTVIHRVGKLKPSDQVVFVGVASKHRQNAFDSCNFIMDWLKTKAPFWKKEETEEGVRWIDSLASDGDRIARWDAS